MKKLEALIVGVMMTMLVACGGSGSNTTTQPKEENQTLAIQTLKVLSGGYTFSLKPNTEVFGVESAYLHNNVMVENWDHCPGIPEIDPENNGKDLLSSNPYQNTLLDYASSGYGILMQCFINNWQFDESGLGIGVFDRSFRYTIDYKTGNAFLTHINNENGQQFGLERLVFPGKPMTTLEYNGVSYYNIVMYEEGGQTIVEYDTDTKDVSGHYRIVFEVPFGIVEMTHTK